MKRDQISLTVTGPSRFASLIISFDFYCLSLEVTKLSFLSGMPRFASQPSAASVHLGSSQVMTCEVNLDLVPFTRWEKDRQPLELSTRLVQTPSGALVISNASEADAGLYRCLVENVGSSKTSDEAQLQIAPGELVFHQVFVGQRVRCKLDVKQIWCFV